MKLHEILDMQPTNEGWKEKAAGLAAAGAIALSGTGCSSNEEWCDKHAEPNKAEKVLRFTSTGRSIAAGRAVGKKIRNCPKSSEDKQGSKR